MFSDNWRCESGQYLCHRETRRLGQLRVWLWPADTYYT